MGNFMFTVLLQRGNIKDNWKWMPDIWHNAWEVKSPTNYHVRYFNFNWLCFQFSWDNER